MRRLTKMQIPFSSQSLAFFLQILCSCQDGLPTLKFGTILGNLGPQRAHQPMLLLYYLLKPLTFSPICSFNKQTPSSVKLSQLSDPFSLVKNHRGKPSSGKKEEKHDIGALLLGIGHGSKRIASKPE